MYLNEHMKNCSLIIIFPLFLLISCNDSVIEIENDLDSNSLLGFVKQVHLLEYINDSLIQDTEIHYSREGFITERKEFMYDSLITTQTISRDEHNRIKLILTTHLDGTVNERLYRYNRNGLKQIEQKVNGKAHTVWNYKNDHLGRKTHETINIDNKMIKSAEYEYLGDTITKTILYKENGKRESSIEFRENKERNIIETIFENYISNEIIAKGKIVLYLDSLNNPITEVHYWNEKVDQTINYWYDFDANRNWIIQIKFLNDKQNEIFERVIEYY